MRHLLVLCAVLACVPRIAAADEPIGRLFYTPAQRAALEDARRRNIRAEERAAAASKKPAAPPPREVVVTGIVLRSDGESAAWVNGKSVDGQTQDGLRVRHTAQPNKVLVYDPEKGRMVPVKVGQRADMLTGRVDEAYERRKRQPAEAAEPADEEDSAIPPAAKPKAPARSAAADEDSASGADAAREPDATPGRTRD